MLLRNWCRAMHCRHGSALAGILLIWACPIARGDAPGRVYRAWHGECCAVSRTSREPEGSGAKLSGRVRQCDVKRVGEDERVDAGFQTRWAWLRDALTSAHGATAPDRENLLRQAAARLGEDSALVEATSSGAEPSFRGARKTADEVLSGSEFQTVTEESICSGRLAGFCSGWMRHSKEYRGLEAARRGWFR